MLQAFGADDVLYPATSANSDDPSGYRRLDDLLREVDIVSLHVPLTPETAGLISRERLALMRRGSILINTARGGLVDQDALVDALQPCERSRSRASLSSGW